MRFPGSLQKLVGLDLRLQNYRNLARGGKERRGHRRKNEAMTAIPLLLSHSFDAEEWTLPVLLGSTLARLAVDTGSSDIWVKGSKFPAAKSTDIGETFFIQYDSGGVMGKWCLTVKLPKLTHLAATLSFTLSLSRCQKLLVRDDDSKGTSIFRLSSRWRPGWDG